MRCFYCLREPIHLLQRRTVRRHGPFAVQIQRGSPILAVGEFVLALLLLLGHDLLPVGVQHLTAMVLAERRLMLRPAMAEIDEGTSVLVRNDIVENRIDRRAEVEGHAREDVQIRHVSRPDGRFDGRARVQRDDRQQQALQIEWSVAEKERNYHRH